MAAEKYEYTPLAWRRQIRLLRLLPPAGPDDSEISVDLVPVSLDAAPPFQALSYAWGDPLPRYEIRCSGCRTEIGPSLHSALRHQRPFQFADGRSRWMWADALCINQDNIAEREAQVRIMGDIYSTAEATVIWLGEEDDHVTRAFEWIKLFNYSWKSFMRDHEIPDAMDHEHKQALTARLSVNDSSEARAILRAAFGERSTRIKAIEDIWILLRRPWFMRKWVIQEVFNSNHHGVVFVAGGKWTHWGYLKSWFTFLELSLDTRDDVFLQCPWGHDAAEPNEMDAWNVMARGTILSQAFFTHDLPLSNILASTAIFKCSNPSDHIIALLGVAADSSMFRNLIDYEVSPDELYRRLTCTYLNDGRGLRILWSIHSMIPVDQRRATSWIPNVEEMNSKSIASHMSNLAKFNGRIANACGNTEIQATASGNRLSIRGRIVDVIKRLGTDMTVFPDLYQSHAVSYTNEYRRYLSLTEYWADECQSIAEEANVDKHDFVDTMLIENFFVDTPQELVVQAKEDFFRIRQIRKAFLAAQDEVALFEAILSMGWKIRRSDNIISRFHWHMYSRRFGRTRYGKIGWMSLVAEDGDYICVFDGMDIPYILRQKEGQEGKYLLVGECFIPSLMNGQAMEMPGVKSAIITLE